MRIWGISFLYVVVFKACGDALLMGEKIIKYDFYCTISKKSYKGYIWETLISSYSSIPDLKAALLPLRPNCISLSPCRRSSLSIASVCVLDLKATARCLPGRYSAYATSLHRRHTPCPVLLDLSRPPVVLARCFSQWQRVRSESKRKLIWRCSGKWLAFPRIGNASTATNAARPMSTWQWAPSSVPPVLGSCEFLVGCLWVSGRIGLTEHAVDVGEIVCSATDSAVPLAC